MHIQSSSNFSLRARELYESLPKNGTAEQRWSSAKRSLDTLSLEFSQQPENQLIKLTHGLAKKLSTKVDQEALFRTALGAAADGCLASGAGLAGLGLKLAALAPPERRQQLEQKAWDSLADRPEFQEIASLGHLAQPGWFQANNPELDRALLRSASEGFDQRGTALEILKTPIEGRPLHRLVSSQTPDLTVLAVLDSATNVQEQRGFVWDFLAQPNATASQIAHSAQEHKMTSGPVLEAMANALSAQGNDSGKFLLLARAAGIHQNEALASVTDDGQNLGERALVQKALDFSRGYLKNHANYLKLTETLTSVLPQGQWRQAAQVVAEDMKVWSNQKFATNLDFVFRQHMSEVVRTKEGQSPLLVACHSTALWRYNHQQALGNLRAPAPEKEFAKALSLATEASDVQTLNECLKICREQGQQAAMEHLRQAAQLETPKPWCDAMAPLGESDPPGQVW